VATERKKKEWKRNGGKSDSLDKGLRRRKWERQKL
jgi:hypothetical protein